MLSMIGQMKMEGMFLPDQILSQPWCHPRRRGDQESLKAAIEYCEKARYKYKVLGATSVVVEVELYLAQLKSQH